VKEFAGVDEKVFGFDHSLVTVDAEGRPVKQTWHTADGSPAQGLEGCSEAHQEYGLDGQLTRLTQRGFDKESSVDHCVVEYTPQSEEQQFYDRRDRPALHNEYGYSRRVSKSSLFGLGIIERLHDTEGNELDAEVRVDFVYPGGIGDRLGIKQGDVFVKYGLVPIRTPSQLSFLTQAETELGGVFPAPTLVLRRDDETLEFKKTEPGFMRLIAALCAKHDG
jgi:hypothetical protein